MVQKSGCGLLLDLNNVYVTATNITRSEGEAVTLARAYIDAIDLAAVGEFHLAGHTSAGHGDGQVLIDSHSTHVCKQVWDLYRAAVARMGPRPTLIEWDLEIPELPVLMAEAARAQAIIDASQKSGRHVA